MFHLIEKNKVDIYDIPISLIADQFLDYVTQMQEMDLDVASEFLVMASTLLHIKSRMMLPAAHGAEDDGADPRDELVVNMLEYRKYKEFSASLRENAAYWGGARYRAAGIYVADAGAGVGAGTGVGLGVGLGSGSGTGAGAGMGANAFRNAEQLSYLDMDRNRLLSVYRKLLEARRRRHEYVGEKMHKIIEREKITLTLKTKEILAYLSQKRRFLFQKVYNPSVALKLDIVVAFGALLELSQHSRVKLRQKKQFGGLMVSRSESKAQ